MSVLLKKIQSFQKTDDGNVHKDVVFPVFCKKKKRVLVDKNFIVSLIALCLGCLLAFLIQFSDDTIEKNDTDKSVNKQGHSGHMSQISIDPLQIIDPFKTVSVPQTMDVRKSATDILMFHDSEENTPRIKVAPQLLNPKTLPSGLPTLSIAPLKFSDPFKTVSDTNVVAGEAATVVEPTVMLNNEKVQKKYTQNRLPIEHLRTALKRNVAQKMAQVNEYIQPLTQGLSHPKAWEKIKVSPKKTKSTDQAVNLSRHQQDHLAKINNFLKNFRVDAVRVDGPRSRIQANGCAYTVNTTVLRQPLLKITGVVNNEIIFRDEYKQEYRKKIAYSD